MYAITRLLRCALLGAAALALAACDNATTDGDHTAGASQLPSASAFVYGDGTASFSSTLRVTDPGYIPYGGSLPALETTAFGTVEVTGEGYAAVSLSVDHFSSDPLLAATVASEITSTPDALHFTIGGQSRTYPLEPFMQEALSSLTQETAGAGASAQGEPAFKDLPLAERLQSLSDDGFQVQALRLGRYQLTRTHTDPSGGTLKTTMVYDGNSGAISDTKVFHDDVLVSEMTIPGGGSNLEATLYTGLSGEAGRTVEIEMPLVPATVPPLE